MLNAITHARAPKVARVWLFSRLFFPPIHAEWHRMEARLESFSYDDAIVRKFLWATVIWGLVGFLVGLIIAIQLAYPALNIAPWFSFGRLRPLHTNAVIFAFGGNAIFTGAYYSSQRLLKARMFSDALSKFQFWAGRPSSSRPRSRFHWDSRRPRNTPSSSGRSTSPSPSSGWPSL